MVLISHVYEPQKLNDPTRIYRIKIKQSWNQNWNFHKFNVFLIIVSSPLTCASWHTYVIYYCFDFFFIELCFCDWHAGTFSFRNSERRVLFYISPSSFFVMLTLFMSLFYSLCLLTGKNIFPVIKAGDLFHS